MFYIERQKDGKIDFYNSLGQICKDELYIDGPQAQELFYIKEQKAGKIEFYNSPGQMCKD